MARKKTSGISPSEALAAIQKGTIEPVYLLYGPEMFLADQLIDRIIHKVFNAPTDDFNLHIFYGKEAAGEDVLTAAMSFPMLADRKVVVLKDAEGLDIASKETLIAYLKNPHDSTCLIVVSSKPDFRQKFFKAFQEQAVCVEYSAPTEADLPEWVERFVRDRGKTMEPNATLLLSSRIDSSLFELSSQVEKLCAFAGNRETITSEDVEAVVGISRQYNVFELCRAVFSRNLPRAIHIFDRMIYHGESPIGMIAMMYRQVSILWQIRVMQEARNPASQIQSHLQLSKVWPELLKTEYLPQAERFTATELERAFESLLDADTQLKSSSVSDTIVMHRLLYTLTKGLS